MGYEMSKSDTTSNVLLGKILSDSGLPEIFGIDQNNLSLKKNQEGIQILAGFLKEAAEGNIGDPNDLPTWQEVGERVFEKKRI
jgi:hypothetical protein